mmetsp:Transcript_107916/g.170467  ORF Transcript_107916/g.170467 Transcript_107916/m.170467 type:complete len:496 (+) Transcript_107916:137-1624(+)
MSGDGSESYTSASESYSSDADQKSQESKAEESATDSRSSTSKSGHSASGDSDHSSVSPSKEEQLKDASVKCEGVLATENQDGLTVQDFAGKAVVLEKEIEDPRRVEIIKILLEAPSDSACKSSKALHGRAFNIPSAPPPHVVWSSSSKPRRRSPDGLTATEYTDTPAIFNLKVELFANMLRASKKTLAYTGAGLSVSAGIGMSAVGSSCGAGSGTGVGVGLVAEPTIAHVVMTELYNQEMLQKWVQRNHDGLPQKAGYPQEHITEIHGSWFDPSNPVIKYTGCLRDDLFENMENQADEADLVLVLGTSLTGLNADQCVTKTASRSLNGDALGTVVISPQRTPQDGRASLRIYAKADEVMVALARCLGLGPRLFQQAHVLRSADRFSKQNRILVPYDENGVRSSSVQTYWDLSPGQRVHISSHNNLAGARQGIDKGITEKTIGVVSGRDELSCSISINFRGTTKKLGLWWLDTARRGVVEYLPVVNVNAKQFVVYS